MSVCVCVGGGGWGREIKEVVTVCPILRCAKEQLSSFQPQRLKVGKFHEVVCLM